MTLLKLENYQLQKHHLAIVFLDWETKSLNKITHPTHSSTAPPCQSSWFTLPQVKDDMNAGDLLCTEGRVDFQNVCFRYTAG